MADPGFPIGGVPTHWGGATSDAYFLAKTYVKMKEMDPVGGHMPAAPPGPATVFVMFSMYNMQYNF